jgi:hypothetical protein
MATPVSRLARQRPFLQVVAGTRRVGRASLVGQALDDQGVPSFFVHAHTPTLSDTALLVSLW